MSKILFTAGQKVRWVDLLLEDSRAYVESGPDENGCYNLRDCETSELCYGYADYSGQHRLQIVLV
jgi:hypothetical protein